MDLDDIVDAWIDHAITQHEVPPPNQSRGHYNITYALYLHILTSIEHRNLNVQNTMPKVLNMLYPGINLPAKISNLTRKVEKYNGDLSVAIEGIQPKSVPEYIGNYCQEAGLKLLHLKNGSIEYHIHPKYVTNGLIYELEKYRRSKNLPRRSIIQWTSHFFPQSASQNPNPNAHYHAWTSLYTEVTRQTHDATKVKSDTDVNQAHLQGYLSQLFIFPQVQASPSEQMTSALSNPPTEKIQSSAQPLLAIAKYQGEVFCKYVWQTDAKLDCHSRKIHHLQNEVKNREQQHDHMKNLLRNLEVPKDEAEKDRQHLTVAIWVRMTLSAK